MAGEDRMTMTKKTKAPQADAAPARRGRPPTGRAETMTLHVRLTQEERDAFGAEALTRRQPLSSWLRTLGRVATGLDRRRR